MPLSSSHWRTAFARMRESTALYSRSRNCPCAPSTMKIVSDSSSSASASWMLRRAEFFITALLYLRRSASACCTWAVLPRLTGPSAGLRDLLPSGKWESSCCLRLQLVIVPFIRLTISGSAVLTVAGLAEGFSASGGKAGKPLGNGFHVHQGHLGERDSGGDGETDQRKNWVSPRCNHHLFRKHVLQIGAVPEGAVP